MNGTTTPCAVSLDEDRGRLRAAADELRAAGIPNADKLLRIGAAAMAERCIASWRAKPDATLGQLAQMVVQGGPSETDVRPASQRQRILAEMNAWQAGYGEAP